MQYKHLLPVYLTEDYLFHNAEGNFIREMQKVFVREMKLVAQCVKKSCKKTKTLSTNITRSCICHEI